MDDRTTPEQEAHYLALAKAVAKDGRYAEYEAIARLHRELDATRADLAELVGALPKCAQNFRCEHLATRVLGFVYCCDVCFGQRDPEPHNELPWAPVLRRLAREGGGK